MGINQKFGDKFEDEIADLLGWETRDKVHGLKIADVVGDGFCGECKATKSKSRSIGVDLIKKIKFEALKYNANDWVIFSKVRDEDGSFIVTATIPVDLFEEFVELRKSSE